MILYSISSLPQGGNPFLFFFVGVPQTAFKAVGGTPFLLFFAGVPPTAFKAFGGTPFRIFFAGATPTALKAIGGTPLLLIFGHQSLKQSRKVGIVIRFVYRESMDMWVALRLCR